MRFAQGVIGFAVAAFLAAPAAAGAGTVSVSDSTENWVEYSALPGESNSVVFSPSAGRGHLVAVRDSAGLAPGRRCGRPNPADRTLAVCAPDLAAGGSAVLQAALGDGNDTFSLAGRFGIDVDGGPGADRLTGGPGDDELLGGDGRDTLRGHRGEDRLSAGSGGAAASGGAGEDSLQGGSGADALDGGGATDLLSGVGGNDVLRARDGTPDEVYCGRGRDRAAVDDVDFISSACEKPSRGRTGAATLIEQDYRFYGPNPSEGGTNLLIGCPGDGPRTCAGTVIVRRGKTVLGRGPFRIRRDRVDQAPKVMPTKAGRALRTGKPVKASVTLVTRGRKGRRVVRRRAGIAEDFPNSEFE